MLASRRRRDFLYLDRPSPSLTAWLTLKIWEQKLSWWQDNLKRFKKTSLKSFLLPFKASLSLSCEFQHNSPYFSWLILSMPFSSRLTVKRKKESLTVFGRIRNWMVIIGKDKKKINIGIILQIILLFYLLCYTLTKRLKGAYYEKIRNLSFLWFIINFITNGLYCQREFIEDRKSVV